MTAALAALAFVVLALLRPRLGLPASVLAGVLAFGYAGAAWWGGQAGPAIAAEAAAAFAAAFGYWSLAQDAPQDRLVRAGLLAIGAAAVWSLPPLAAGIALGEGRVGRPQLVELQAAGISLHHLSTWRVGEADGLRTLVPPEGDDAWIAISEPPGVAPGADGLKAALDVLARPHAATPQPKVRSELIGYQARTLGGDEKLLFWGCEAFRGPAGRVLLLEYGVRRTAKDPRRRLRELEAILATLQPGG